MYHQDYCVGSCKIFYRCLYYFQNNTPILIVYNDFYSNLLHVSAVYFSHHQTGVLVHTQNKKGEAFPYKHWVDTFGFPPEVALALKHVGILCVMYNFWGTRWRSWLKHCATSRQGKGSIPDIIIGIFH